MCVICRRRFPKAVLTRHTMMAQGNLIIDSEKIRFGRGLYLCSDPCCMVKFAQYMPCTKRRGDKYARRKDQN
ncbi:DUF448 domain-containing protein [Candidatus Desulfovibrio trichonymphae]|uniref:DUF448 domain-containing protein n=1 Tax=Candidatus Desulfovibrio trichonymphae TaxID=1725232 RepID=UPI0038BCD9E2